MGLSLTVMDRGRRATPYIIIGAVLVGPGLRVSWLLGNYTAVDAVDGSFRNFVEVAPLFMSCDGIACFFFPSRINSRQDNVRLRLR